MMSPDNNPSDSVELRLNEICKFLETDHSDEKILAAASEVRDLLMASCISKALVCSRLFVILSNVCFPEFEI